MKYEAMKKMLGIETCSAAVVKRFYVVCISVGFAPSLSERLKTKCYLESR